MSGSVSIGVLTGTLAMRDEFSAQLAKLESRLKVVEESTKRTTRTTKSETDKVNEAYKRVAASLDPVVANTQKYEKAEKALNDALKRGTVSQDEYNKLLGQAKEKYSSTRSESDKLASSYKRLVSDLDSSSRGQKQYKQSLDILDQSLRKGIITQQEYNKRLAEAKEKYLSASESAEKYANKVKDIGGQLSSTGANISKFVTLPIAAIGGLSVNAAREFESSFAGVKKTVDATEEEFESLKSSLREMAAGPKPIPIDVNTLNAIAESAGQLGIAKSRIVEFTGVMADLGETTNLTALEASESTAQFQNIFGKAGQDVDRFGSTLVALGNSGASTEKSILSMGLRIAGAGNQIGLTQGQVLAYASALSSVGIEAEAGGSAISKIMIEIALAVSKGGKELKNFAAISRMSTGEFKDLFAEDAAGAVASFIEGLGQLKSEGGDVLGVIDQLGITEIRMRDALLRAAGAGDLLRNSLDLQAKAWSENTALTDEAKKRYETFDSQLQIFKNQVKDVAITFGTSLLPALKSAFEVAKPWIDMLANMARGFADLDPGLQKIILLVAGLVAGIGPAVFITGQLIQAWGQILIVAPQVANAMTIVSIATKGLIVGGVLLFINELIKGWGRASAAAIQYNADLAKIQGTSLAFARDVAKGAMYQTVTQENFDSKLKEAEILQTAVQSIYKDLMSLRKIGFKGDIATADDSSFLNPKKAVALQNEYRGLLTAHNKLRTSLAQVAIASKDVAKAVDPSPFKGIETDIKKTSKSTDQLTQLFAEQAEAIRFLKEQEALAAKGPGLDIATRLHEEQRINDEHEYRVSLLKMQSQFGKTIGEQLAKQEQSIKLLARKVKMDLEVSMKLAPIKMDAAITKQFDNSMKVFLDRFKETEKIANDNAEAFASVGKAHDDWLESFAEGWKESFKTTGDLIRDEMGSIEEAVADGYLSVAEGERAIAILRAEFLQQTIDAVNAAGSFISQFGAVVKNANLQKWGSFISQASGAVDAANKFSVNPSTITMLGAAGAWLGAFVTIAEMFTTKKGIHFGADIGDVGGGSAGVTNEWTYVKGQLDEARKAGKAIASTINEIVTALGAELVDLADFTIEQKGEGWAVTFAGQFRRYFDEFQDALAYGVSQALAMSDLSGISQDIAKALKENVFDTVEELQQFIEFARDYSRIGLSDLTASLMDVTSRLTEGARKATEYGLEIGKITDEFGRQVGAVRDNILGIVRSPEEQLRANVVDFNNWISQQKLAAQIQIDSANAQMVAARLQMDAARVNLKGLGLDRDPEMIALFLDAEKIWKDAAGRLDLWTKALNNLPPTITPEEEEEARRRLRGSGGGGRGGEKQSARDFVKDRTFELSLIGLTGYQRSLKELDKQYADLIAQAGKDKKLKDDLLKLKESELALLREEEGKRVSKVFKDFVAPSSDFDKVRETAQGLIDDISKSPFGDARKAGMIGRVLDSLSNKIDELSKTTALNMFGSLLQDMEKYGASEAQLTEIRYQMAIIEHTLKVANYQAEFAILKANGTLSNEILGILENAINFVSGIDPTKFILPPTPAINTIANDNFSTSVDNTTADLDRLREAFRSAKDSILDTVLEFDRGGLGAIVPEVGWEETKRQFDQVISSAKAGNLAAFEEAPETFRNTLDVLQKFSPALFATLAPQLRDQLKGLADLNTVKDGNLVITDFEKRAQHKEVVNTLSNGFTDISLHASKQEEMQTQMLAQIVEFNTNQRAVSSRLDRIESQMLTFGVKGN